MTLAAGTTIQSFRAEALADLLADGKGPHLSIYLPTHRRHPEWKQDPVRFRALLGQAAELLQARYTPREIEPFLEPLRTLEREADWEHALDGLALFRTQDSTAMYRLPMPVPELVVVAETYHTKPLLRFLRSNGRYLVLAISQKAVTLYEGTSYGAGPVNLSGLPTSLREALGVREPDRIFESQYVRGSQFHGQGPGKEIWKEEMLQFFRKIDRGLHDYLRDERVPLLLASVKYYHPIYAIANRYPGLLEEQLTGNYERATADRIHAEAWPIVSRIFDARVSTWADRYRSRAGTGLGSDRLEEIATAAVTGRIQCLLVPEEESVWGILDRATGAIQRRDRQQDAQDADLLDDIAEEAYKRGAEVYVVPRASMPAPGPLAAIYRF